MSGLVVAHTNEHRACALPEQRYLERIPVVEPLQAPLNPPQGLLWRPGLEQLAHPATDPRLLQTTLGAFGQMIEECEGSLVCRTGGLGVAEECTKLTAAHIKPESQIGGELSIR
ncbi:MAG: hypothetical protein HGA45_42870 [Chloroflexales bacterium]|nr:hypothetical protein [Chloroflexales bacterium]